MQNKRIFLVLMTAVLTLFVAACSQTEQTDQVTSTDEQTHTTSENNDNMSGHDSAMEHSASGELPAGIKEAANPQFPVGSQAMMTADHMEGMNGAEATIIGAFDTTAYEISYTPTTGGERVNNHKWIVHEEIQGADDEMYQPGDEVVVEADHMEGMKGAKAVIDSAKQTTVYMVDYTSTTTGEQVKNHKWVTEQELNAE